MLLDPLFQHAQSQGQSPAIIDDSGQYTFQQLAAMSVGLGMYLAGQTDRPRVGLLLPASAGFAASFYGTLLAGKAAVPINFLLGEREMAHVIRDSGIDTVVTIPILGQRLAGLPLKVVDLTKLPKPPAGLPATPSRLPTPAASDMAVLLYTSGTSGLPKGVVLTYGNLQSDVEAAIEHAQLKDRHRFLGIVPLFHSTGMLATLLAPTTLGAMVVYQARFSPLAVVKALREHQISVLAAVPSMYAALLRLKEAGPEDVKSMYAAISGGEPLPANVREGFTQKFGIPLFEGYGLTETIGPVAFNTPQNHRAGSVGRLIPGAQARIVDDDGHDATPGLSGEVWLRGPMVMQGYFNLPDETAAARTADGYFRTGDLGLIDAEGYLHITGRKKDLIIVAGEKAVPREIEETIMRHPGVADCAVVGKKDASRGEVVVAFVVPREGQEVKPEEIRSFAGDQGLPNWKVPREVHIVNDLPRSPTGKVLKRVLAEKLSA
jgi:long-chain acyl-CoA synthetase